MEEKKEFKDVNEMTPAEQKARLQKAEAILAEQEKSRGTTCDTCAYYAFDEEYGGYLCDINMDEDDFARRIQGCSSPELSRALGWRKLGRRYHKACEETAYGTRYTYDWWSGI